MKNYSQNEIFNLTCIAKDAHTRKRRMRFLTFLDKHIAPSDKVLDIGCGDGVITEYLQKKGIQIVGIDKNVKLLEIAKTYHCPVIQVDALEYLDTEAVKDFTLFLMIDFIEHLVIEQVEELLKKIPKGSKVIIKTPNTDCIMGLMLYATTPSHVQPIPKTILRELLTQNGYQILDLFMVDFLLSPIFSPKLFYPKLLIKFFPGIFDGGNYVCVAKRIP